MTVAAEIVVCARPHGCGWAWERRTERRHRWSRPVILWGGPVFEDGETVAFRWHTDDQFRGEYSDCLPYLAVESPVYAGWPGGRPKVIDA